MIEAFEIGVSLALETGDAQTALKGLGQQLSALDTELARVHSGIMEAQRLSAPGHSLVSSENDQAGLRHRSQFDQPEQEANTSAHGNDTSSHPALTDAYAVPSAPNRYGPLLRTPDMDNIISPDVRWQALPPHEHLPTGTGDSTLNIGPQEWQTISFGSAAAGDRVATDTAYRGLSEASTPTINTHVLHDEAEQLSRYMALPPTSGFVALASPGLGNAQPFFDGADVNDRNGNNRIEDHGEANARTTSNGLPRAEKAQTGFTLADVSPAFDLSGIATELARGAAVGAEGVSSPTDSLHGIMLPIARGDGSSLDNKAPETTWGRSSPVPPTFFWPASVQGNPHGSTASTAPSSANADFANGAISQENADPAMVLHTHVHIDGDVVARAVSERLVTWMNGPLSGTGRFDPRRSYTPVES